MPSLITMGLGETGAEEPIELDTSAPTIVRVESIDARTLEVIFSERVVESEALTASNYSVTPELTVVSVRKVTDLVYHLRTSKQTELEVYKLKATGIHDLAGNSI